MAMIPAEVMVGNMACFNGTHRVRCGHCDTVEEACPGLSEAASVHCFACKPWWRQHDRTGKRHWMCPYHASGSWEVPVAAFWHCECQCVHNLPPDMAPEGSDVHRLLHPEMAQGASRAPTPPVQGVARAPTPPVQGVPVFNRWAGSASGAVFTDLPATLPEPPRPQAHPNFAAAPPPLPPGLSRHPSPCRSRRSSRRAQSVSSKASSSGSRRDLSAGRRWISASAGPPPAPASPSLGDNTTRVLPRLSVSDYARVTRFRERLDDAQRDIQGIENSVTALVPDNSDHITEIRDDFAELLRDDDGGDGAPATTADDDGDGASATGGR
ncbi:hypothetical protein N9L68_04680 [bacterium]|nr:hypothetical protein [bacterium]